MVNEWKCETDTCGWKGDYPDSIPSYEYLNIPEEECEELEFVEICPTCKSLAIKVPR